MTQPYISVFKYAIYFVQAIVHYTKKGNVFVDMLNYKNAHDEFPSLILFYIFNYVVHAIVLISYNIISYFCTYHNYRNHQYSIVICITSVQKNINKVGNISSYICPFVIVLIKIISII